MQNFAVRELRCPYCGSKFFMAMLLCVQRERLPESVRLEWLRIFTPGPEERLTC